MVKTYFGGREIECTADELAEALQLDNDIMFNCWLGMVEVKGHEAAMKWAREYDEMLRNPE